MVFKNAQLEKEVDFKVYLPRLESWFWTKLQEIYSRVTVQGQGIVMGTPLWGDEFINRFFHFCLPSIRAPRNFAVLKDNARLVLFTDHEGFKRLWLMARDMTRQGIVTEIHVIPKEIMDLVPDRALNKYWLLGTVQNLCIQIAGRAGMGFHMLMPDHLYGVAYFENLSRIATHYEGIAQTSISADVHACLPEMEQWRQPDGSLAIPDRELGDMGFRHLHKQTRGNMMNGADPKKGLPDSHFTGWVGKDKLHLFCCHMNAAFLSANVCKRAPVRLYNALDTELPAFMPEKVTVPGADDGMTFIELSDDTKIHATHRVDFKGWAIRCWTTVHFRLDYVPFFQAVNEVPIKEQAEFMEAAEIEKQHTDLVQGLLAARDGILSALQKAKDDAEAKSSEEGMAKNGHGTAGPVGAVRLPGGHPLVVARAQSERERIIAGAAAAFAGGQATTGPPA